MAEAKNNQKLCSLLHSIYFKIHAGYMSVSNPRQRALQFYDYDSMTIKNIFYLLLCAIKIFITTLRIRVMKN
jgi:hypothetical protein